MTLKGRSKPQSALLPDASHCACNSQTLSMFLALTCASTHYSYLLGYETHYFPTTKPSQWLLLSEYVSIPDTGVNASLYLTGTVLFHSAGLSGLHYLSLKSFITLAILLRTSFVPSGFERWPSFGSNKLIRPPTNMYCSVFPHTPVSIFKVKVEPWRQQLFFQCQPLELQWTLTEKLGTRTAGPEHTVSCTACSKCFPCINSLNSYNSTSNISYFEIILNKYTRKLNHRKVN